MPNRWRDRIHWFSPLPPAQTDIADFTSRLLPALSARAEVVLWTSQERWSYSLKHRAEVRRFDPRALPLELRDGAIFYNIGNNSLHHAAIWNAARQAPGFAIMHDVFMHDSLAHERQIRQDRAGYLQMMESLYGRRGRLDAELYWDGGLTMPQMGRRYTCARHILDYSLGAIVHSRLAMRTLRRETDLPVVNLPLPFPARPGRKPAPHDGPAPWRLIVFGHLGSNRCLEQVLRGLANVRDPNQFHLDIFGKIDSPGPVLALIEQLRLGERVTVHGFVPPRQLRSALDAAHLAINLRFPTKGEAWGSQLRIWSHALPSLVSRVGWYAELPEDTVVFLRPKALVEDLTAHLEQYAVAPERYIDTGLQGYRYLVETHSPESYATAIVEMAHQARDARDRRNADLLARRATGALEGWLDLPGYAARVSSVAGELAGIRARCFTGSASGAGP